MTSPPVTETIAPLREPEAVPALPPGTRLADRYRLGEVLGHGGFAVVYRAHDERRGLDVALKLLRADRIDASGLKRLEREAALAALVDHPNLVKVLEAGRDGDRVFLTLELVEGESLRARLAGYGPLAVDEAVRIAGAVLAGLAALHAQGIVHRDVTPGNILLDRGRGVKLADFGLVRAFDHPETRVTVTAGLVGTLDYLSPEQALGEPVDARSDLYSLGVVLFEALAGRPVHERATSLAVLIARLRENTPDLRELRPKVPGWLAGLVGRLLEREPEHRYPSAEAALADLRRERASRRKPSRRWRRRAVTLGAIMAIAGLAAWGAWRLADRSRFERLVPDGNDAVQALDRGGRVLWRREGVYGRSNFVPVHFEPGGPLRLAAIPQISSGGLAPVERHRLAFVDPETGQEIRSVELPSAAAMFPEYSDRYRVHLAATDFDGDGVEEIVASYTHSFYSPSYTLLFEPRTGRSRLLFFALGHHRLTGLADLDGDGQNEALFSGYANRLGYQVGLAAVRLVPWIGEPLAGNDDPTSRVTSPDQAAGGGSGQPAFWYALLRPPVGFSTNFEIDLPARRLRLRGQGNGESLAFDFDGFREGTAPAGLDPATRQRRREEAYARLRNAVRLRAAGLAAAVDEAHAAAETAAAIGEPDLADWARTVEATALVAAGSLEEGDALFRRLAVSGPAGIEAMLQAAQIHHRAGRTDRAVAWYREGLILAADIGRGRHPIELLEGLLLALVEAGRFAEAETAIRESSPLIGAPAEVLAGLEAWLAWRRGGSPEPSVLPAGGLDPQRYYRLEFRLARGEDPGRLLADVRADQPEASETRALLLSLESECLARLGRGPEALVKAREALAAADRQSVGDLLVRAHRSLLEARLRRLS